MSKMAIVTVGRDLDGFSLSYVANESESELEAVYTVSARLH